MNMLVKYDLPNHDALSRMIQHSSGTAAGMRRLRAEIDEGAPGTRFSITDPDGGLLIEGTFYGDVRDRDFQLMSARIFAADKVNPQLITYADGVSFTYNQEFDAVINVE